MHVSVLDLAGLAGAGSAPGHYLTDRERCEYDGLRHPGRRREWLGVRICLKTMLVSRGSVSDPLQCEVLKGVRGRPWVSFAPGFPLADVHDCSLSHKDELACACASSVPKARVGVDVERPTPRLAKLTGAFLNDRDAAIPKLSPTDRLAVLWSLKEACSKALGVGLGIGLNEVICEDEEEGRHVLRIKNGPTFRGRHLFHGGYVVTLCMMEDENRVVIA